MGITKERLMLERMHSRDYVLGYMNALKMVVNTFSEEFEDDLKRHRIPRTFKTVRNLLKFILENRGVLREDNRSFVRCNNAVEGGFEIYIEGVGPWRSPFDTTDDEPEEECEACKIDYEKLRGEMEK